MQKKGKYVVDVVFHGEFANLQDAVHAYSDHVFIDADMCWAVNKKLMLRVNLEDENDEQE